MYIVCHNFIKKKNITQKFSYLKIISSRSFKRCLLTPLVEIVLIRSVNPRLQRVRFDDLLRHCWNGFMQLKVVLGFHVLIFTLLIRCYAKEQMLS